VLDNFDNTFKLGLFAIAILGPFKMNQKMVIFKKSNPTPLAFTKMVIITFICMVIVLPNFPLTPDPLQ
jgi:hypothetical protein